MAGDADRRPRAAAEAPGAALDAALRAEAEALRAAHRWRALEPARGGLDFTSSDYLGLARHPQVVEAACRAAREHGAGARAARLLGGGSGEEALLEAEVAAWLGAEAALLFPSGYQANLGLVTALAERGDALVCDALVHASLIDAARLSRARVLVHRHDDPDDVERCLAEARGARRRLVLTEGVFSMDGDSPDLVELARRCARQGALLVVDEAHAVGVVGPGGAGAWAAALEHGADPGRLAARVVTGGKALGVGGALVCGSTDLIRHLVNRARSFVFTTSPPPALVGALRASVALARSMDAERARLREQAVAFATRLDLAAPAAAIVPLVVGSSRRASELAEALRARGFEVRAARPPTVPEGAARLRIVIHADHGEGQLVLLARALEELRPTPGEAAPGAPPPPARLAPALVVCGTDTGIGKTVVAALLARALARRGPARYWKPVQTGPDSDTAEVARLGAGTPLELVAPLRELPLPASPHEAAAAAGLPIDPAALRERLVELRRSSLAPLVVELAGGLLVPYDDRTTQADLLAAEGLPVVLVARAGLGTLNHTLLTLEALRARHVPVAALILVGPPHASNRATLAARGQVPVILELSPLAPLEPEALDRWLAAQGPLPFLPPGGRPHEGREGPL